jgi:hypothetical protein
MLHDTYLELILLRISRVSHLGRSEVEQRKELLPGGLQGLTRERRSRLSAGLASEEKKPCQSHPYCKTDLPSPLPAPPQLVLPGPAPSMVS